MVAASRRPRLREGEDGSMFGKGKKPMPPVAGTAGLDRSPRWEPNKRYFCRKAKRAGKKGLPDPRRSTKAPSCFDELHQLALERVHQEVRFLLDEIEPATKTIKGHEHFVQRLGKQELMTESEERRLMMYRQAEETIRMALLRCQNALHSIVATYELTKSDMQNEFRTAWPYANHFEALVFPDEIRLSDISYPDVGALADLLPATQSTTGLTSIKGVITR